MKPTAYFLVGCLTAWLTIPANPGVAALPPMLGIQHVGLLSLGQANPAPGTVAEEQARSLLRAARAAMQQGDFATAERYIDQVERMNVRFDPLYERFTDTPAKARRALHELRDSRPAAPGAGPGLAANPPAGFTPGMPGGENSNAARAYEMLSGDAKSKARAYLDKARLCLEQSDATGAVAWRQKALATGAVFAPGEYSPETLGAELRQAGISEELLVGPQPAGARPAALRPDDLNLANQPGDGLSAPGTRLDPRSSAFGRPLVTNPYQLETAPDPLAVAGAPPGSRGAAPYGRGDPGLAAGPDGEPRRLPPPESAANAQKAESLRLLALARSTLDRGDLAGAQRLAEQARRLGVPDEAFGPNEPRPEHLLLEIHSALARRGAGLAPNPYGVVQAYDPGMNAPGQYPVQQGVYVPGRDGSRTVAAQALVEPDAAAPNPAPPAAGDPAAGLELFRQGIAALEKQDREAALQCFADAWKYEAQLDPVTRQALRDKLMLLRVARPQPAAPPGSVLEEVDSQQQLLRQKLSREVFQELGATERLLTTDPRSALARLERLKTRIEAEQLDPPSRRQMLTLVERNIQQTSQYIETHLADIELKERNQTVTDEIEGSRQEKLDKQQKLAELVEKFNNLNDEQRYAEAEVLAKQAYALDPDSEVVRSMLMTSRFASRIDEQEYIQRMKEEGVYKALSAVEEASAPHDDRQPLKFGDATNWDQLSRTRSEWLKEQQSRLSPAEQEILNALKKKVDVNFDNRPLAEVVETLGKLAGVNVYLDPQGLHAEGVTSDEAVSLKLSQPISLRSALNLVLEPLHLSYVVQNEVLRVTSEQTSDSDVYPKVYNVADLVIPIPNFIPSYNIGLPGALKEAIQATGQTSRLGSMEQIPFTMAATGGQGTEAAGASVLAQMGSSGMLPGVAPRSPHPSGLGPGNMGGATAADFDTLIDLITSTIAPQTWDTVGGPGSIEGFPTNLSLVVSQTQEVHEQIADLLDQLRRLQDLQVTIEVRFITLNDTFFERIGIDFDMEFDDNSGQIAGQSPIVPDDTGPSIAFGLDPNGQPTIDFDYAFTQNSFGSTIPQFGGFDATTAANVGFAILSDIEVFFLLQAAQGDTRTNVLQAPKVTLFNGQTGYVSDTSQRPFVTSIIPVVGDFAAAHQPVVVVLSEGTSLSVQAVVSPDRRFVRLTLIPFFSSIGDVDTFTFSGKTSSDSGTVVADPANEAETVTNNQQRVIEGTTVQLPTFNFTTVSTTVSVPDGGTVLLGGIKRLSEGRNERGVPFLSKLPYINRLFRNVGIGRDTQSLMMMVTPRIIIQEEEEFLQTGYDSSQQ